MSSGLRKTGKAAGSGTIQDWLSRIWNDPISGKAVRHSLVLFSLLVLIVGLSYWRLPPEIPFTYSMPWGPAQLVPTAFLFFITAGVLVLQVLNFLLAGFLASQEEVLAQIVAWTNVLILLVIDIAVVKVIILVI